MTVPPALGKVKQLVAGETYACAIDAKSGFLWCWAEHLAKFPQPAALHAKYVITNIKIVCLLRSLQEQDNSYS